MMSNYNLNESILKEIPIKLKFIENIECILLVMILNMNAIRVMTKTLNSSIINYIIYALFVMCLLRNVLKYKCININIDFITLGTLFIIFSSLISILIRNQLDYISVWSKFIICILISIKAFTFNKYQINKVFEYVIYFNIFYSTYIIYNIQDINSLLRYNKELINYLVVTLPIGFSLTISLIYMLTENKRIKRVISFFSSLLFILVLLNFQARSNILFPIIIVLFILFKDSIKKSSNIIKLIIFISIILILFSLSKEQSYSQDLFTRMERLLIDIKSEPRIVLYTNYLNYILDKFRWIFGVGFNNSEIILANMGMIETYPHNLIIELFGELGVFALIICIIMSINIYIYCKKANRILCCKRNVYGLESRIYNYILCGFMFYLMTYMKSYSIYDAYHLFILIAFIVKIYTIILAEKSYYRIIKVKI